MITNESNIEAKCLVLPVLPGSAQPATAFGVDGLKNGLPEGVGQVTWTPLVERIRSGDDSAATELYHRLRRPLQFLIWKLLGHEDTDVLHDVFIAVLESIRLRSLRHPEALPGFARAVARNHIARAIRQEIWSRQYQCTADQMREIRPTSGFENPEDDFFSREDSQVARKALASLRKRDREILRRFYIWEQTQDQICKEMNLTATQFRLLKSRAKAAFGQKGKSIASGSRKR